MLTKTKERGILMSAPMVLAVLEGRKTVTRRIVKAELPKGCESVWKSESDPELGRFAMYSQEDVKWIQCPYGKVGDRLWAREAWKTSIALDERKPSEMEKAGVGLGYPIWYEADGGKVTWRGSEGGGSAFVTPGKYRHARFMPRWASRLTLEITDIKIERLNDISEEDAKAEGVAMDGPYGEIGGTYVQPFIRLWQEINGRDSWELNPWVFAISFKRIELTEAQ